jgi:hypothetical protein
MQACCQMHAPCGRGRRCDGPSRACSREAAGSGHRSQVRGCVAEGKGSRVCSARLCGTQARQQACMCASACAGLDGTLLAAAWEAMVSTRESAVLTGKHVGSLRRGLLMTRSTCCAQTSGSSGGDHMLRSTLQNWSCWSSLYLAGTSATISDATMLRSSGWIQSKMCACKECRPCTS